MDAAFFDWLRSDTGRNWFERAGRADLLTLAEYCREHEGSIQRYTLDVDAIEREAQPYCGYADLYREFLAGAQYLHDCRERGKRLTAKLNEARRRGEVFPKDFRDWWKRAWDAEAAASEVRDE